MPIGAPDAKLSGGGLREGHGLSRTSSGLSDADADSKCIEKTPRRASPPSSGGRVPDGAGAGRGARRQRHDGDLEHNAAREAKRLRGDHADALDRLLASVFCVSAGRLRRFSVSTSAKSMDRVFGDFFPMLSALRARSTPASTLDARDPGWPAPMTSVLRSAPCLRIGIRAPVHRVSRTPTSRPPLRFHARLERGARLAFSTDAGRPASFARLAATYCVCRAPRRRDAGPG